MSRLKKVMKGRKGTFLLLGAAVLLLAGSAVGSARAALTYYSENYTAQMEMYDIGVTLVEESAKGSKDISSVIPAHVKAWDWLMKYLIQKRFRNFRAISE